MATIDYVIIIVYLAGTLALGVWLGRRIRTGKDYFLAGRTLPWWAIGLSLVVSDIGAKDIVGLAQEAYTHGWVMANWDWLGCIPAMILAALVFVPYFWAGGFYTVPEYFGRRYNEGVQLIATLVWGFFIAGNVGGIFAASTAVLTPMLGIARNLEWAVLVVSAVFVGVYTYRGGLAAVVYTDVIQCILMIAGMGLVLYFAFEHPAVGSWDALRERVTATHPDHFKMFHPPENPSSFTTFSVVFGLGVVMGPAYWIGNQVIVQRVLGARSIGDARGGVLFGALVKSIFPILLVLPGILAIAILPGEILEGETKEIFPRLVRDLLPAGVRGIVLAAMVAGLMGNLDSYLNSASTLWTRDVLRKYFFRDPALKGETDASARLDLRLGRVLTVLLLICGVVVAPYITRIFEFMQLMLSLFQGPFLALLLFGMFWRRASAWGGLAGIVIGLSAALTLTLTGPRLFGYPNPYLHVAWWSFVVSCASVFLVSLLTRPHEAARLEGLVFGSRRENVPPR